MFGPGGGAGCPADYDPAPLRGPDRSVTDSAPFRYAGEAAALASSLLWACAGVVFRRLKGRADPGAVNLAKNSTAAVCFVVLLLVTTGLPWPTGLSARAVLLLSAS